MGFNSDSRSWAQDNASNQNGDYAKSSVDQTLSITDNRTGKQYTVPISRNSINAMSFKQMTAKPNPNTPCDQTEYGIRVYDPGYGNTAVSESNIAYK